MIQAVTIVNPKNESFRIELKAPEKSGIAIESIEGLGPSQADINSFDVAGMDGSFYTSSRMTDRNIIFNLIPWNTHDIESIRLKTYQYFPIKKKIKIIFETDQQYRWCEGYVERNEPTIFSDRETIQISIICPIPYFYAQGEEAQVFSGVRSLFEFPFSNESLDDNTIEFGQIMLDTRVTFNYEGDIDTGMVITIHCLDVVSNIVLYNVDTRERIKILTDKITSLLDSPIMEGDDIIISTVNGKKGAYILRKGVQTNIISAIDKNADWFQITPGKNTFDFSADSGENELLITMTYDVVYGGI